MASGPTHVDESTAGKRADSSQRSAEPSSGAPATAFGRGGRAPRDLVALQRLAGNHAVTRLLTPRPSSPRVQRDGPGAAPGAASVHWQGQLLTTDPAQLRSALENLVVTRGQAEAETFAYSFLRMDVQEKLALGLSSGGDDKVTQVQQAFEPVLRALQAEQQPFLESIGPKVLQDTKDVLAESKELLKAEELKYTDTFPAQAVKPDLDGLRVAAKALAAKRKAADTAGAAAQAANRAMVDQNMPKAEFGSPLPAPQMPYFPNPELRETAFRANDAWWKLEEEYGALRAEKDKQFPVLAMYGDNEDGGAASRLDDLPTWGPLADFRQKDRVVSDIRKRLMNIQEVEHDLDIPKAWQLPRMLEASLKGLNAPPYKQRWARDNANKLAAQEAETQQIYAGVAIALVIVTAAMTAGAALAVEGSVAAATFSTLAAAGTGMSAGMSIATAYSDLRDYQFKKASTQTSMESARSIASGDPSFLWVAVELLAAVADVGAATTAFKTATAAIKSVEAGDQVIISLKAIEGASGPASGKIIPRVIAEADASGALERAVVAEGKRFEEAGLTQMHQLIEQGLGRAWGEEFAYLKAGDRVLPLTEDALKGVYGPQKVKKIMGEKGFEKMLGFYDPDLRKAFVRPDAEGELANRIVHEMSHGFQGWKGSEYAAFTREFEAYAAQREIMRQLNRAYGWQPKSSAWLLNASDWDVTKHIRLEYGYPVPPWVVEGDLNAPVQLDKAFKALTRQLQQF